MFRVQWQGIECLHPYQNYQAGWTVDVLDVQPQRRFRLLLNLDFLTLRFEIEWVLTEIDFPSSGPNENQHPNAIVPYEDV